MPILVSLLVVVSVWAITATIFLAYRNPLPFPDRGHRCFSVKNELVAQALVEAIGPRTGLSERFTFDPGPTHQMLLWDNTTVIIWHDPIVKEKGLPPNAMSVVVDDPENTAAEVAYELTRRTGIAFFVVKDVLPEVGNKFALVKSEALDGWALAFRRHILAMGRPPNKRKVSYHRMPYW